MPIQPPLLLKRKGRKPSARKKLIASAYKVMAANGLDGSSIAEIIDQAGVGVGSFYYHFSSKEDLAKAVFSERAEELGANLEHVALTSDNIAAATCYAFRRLIEELESDALWAAFIVQLEPSLQMLDGLLRDHARAGLRSGIENGNLRIYDVDIGITAFHAVVISVAKLMLSGHISSSEAHRASYFGLRMFGVSEDDAMRLSNLSMSELQQKLGPRHAR